MESQFQDPLHQQSQALKEKLPLIFPDQEVTVLQPPPGMEEGEWVSFYYNSLSWTGSRANPTGRARVLFWIRVCYPGRYPPYVESAYLVCPDQSILVRVNRVDVHPLTDSPSDTPARRAE